MARLLELYFEDLEIGQTEITHRRTVTEADVTFWCMFTGDWFPIHCDVVYAEQSQFKQRIAPGLMVVAMVGGLAVPAQTKTVIANYGTERIRYPAPTYIGDTLQVHASVSRLQERDEKTGLVDITWDVHNQHDKVVCSMVIRILMKRRAADAAERSRQSASAANA